MAFLRKIFPIGAILALFLAQSALFLVIPSVGVSMFLSPDETANAVSSRVFAQTGSMKISDPILKDGSWLHPRSYVTQGDAMVPVGFLGLPMVIGLLSRFAGEWALMLFVPLLVLSACFPIWRFLSSSGRIAQIVGVVTWLSFPTVILYANRDLYPNLPVVCLGLWAAFLLWEKRSVSRSIIAGLAAGLAIAIRPVEIVWLLPWLIAAWRFRQDRQQHKERRSFAIFVVCALIPMLGAAFVAWKTYGTPFAIGYWLRDPVMGAVQLVSPATRYSPLATHSLWPFGFHPKNMWFNVHSYFFGEWMPWVVLSIVCGILLWRRSLMRVPVIVGLWTVVVGVFMYGQSIYQDHVGMNVISSGNSFLRYMIPFAVIAALSIGTLCGEAAKKFGNRRFFRVMAALVAMIIVVTGTNIAFAGDDENILVTSQELSRYSAIRASAFSRFGPQLIVLSDRSDKIFFPTFRVASPLPSMDHVYELVNQAPVPVAYFTETLSDDAQTPWKNAGIVLRPVFQNGNQTMYALSITQASLK